MKNTNSFHLPLLFFVSLCVFTFMGWVGPVSTASAQVTVTQALGLKPVQRGEVDFTTPGSDEIENCTLSAPENKKHSGWVVKDQAGRILRRFLDTNGDSDIDLWCYYKDGFEVYRDVDSNFDRKADQYRWFGSQGTRWGLDKDQDGVIDQWKRISAEEVSAEVVAALRTGNEKRLEVLLLAGSELKDLGFGKDKEKVVAQTISKTKDAIKNLMESKEHDFSKGQWVHFGGLRPGIIPQGTDGSQKDIVIYENVAALIRTPGKDLQISLGTMIQSGASWRMIDIPQIVDEKATMTLATWYRNTPVESVGLPKTGSGDAAYQKLLAEFETLDKKIAAATSASEKAKVYDLLAATTSGLALKAESEEDSLNWARQFADSITAAFQSGDYPDGVERLGEFAEQLKDAGKSPSAIGLVRYRVINASFGAKLNDKDADIAKAQSDWLKDLEEFSKAYPDDENSADAMMQLAMADEFDGEKEAAEDWYKKVVSGFKELPYSRKAAGAIKRLNSVGKTLELKGKTVNGVAFDLADHQGKVVLVHYWADWCEICKKEFSLIDELREKYGKKLVVVGVNCDADIKLALEATRKTGVKWTQLYSEGGYNDGLAAEMGIVSLPSMILVDQGGEIVSTTVSSTTLQRDLTSIIK